MAITVLFTQSRIEDVVTIDELIGALSGNLLAIETVIRKMIVDEGGKYVSDEEAEGLIKTVTIGEFKKLSQGIAKELRDALVNPTSGGT